MSTEFLLFLNIGGGELFFVMLMVVMLFGAGKIPEVARGLGKAIRQIRDATEEIKREVKDSVRDDEDLRKTKEELEKGKKELDEIEGSIKRNTKL